PSSGADPLRLPYPNVSQLTELDPRLGYDVVMRAEMEPLIVAAKHRMILTRDGDTEWKLVYAPTRKGARYFLFDRGHDAAEVKDLSTSRLDVVARLKPQLWRWMLGDPSLEERDGLLVPRDAQAELARVGGLDASVVRLK
ncbi:MAG: hypothetical protein ACHREM_07545, partial [Polyangiales bacterium]